MTRVITTVWVDVADDQPSLGEQVLVYNGVHLWLTGWKPGLVREDLRFPVTHWSRRFSVPYAIGYSAVDVDPECMSDAKAQWRERRRLAKA